MSFLHKEDDEASANVLLKESLCFLCLLPQGSDFIFLRQIKL